MALRKLFIVGIDGFIGKYIYSLTKARGVFAGGTSRRDIQEQGVCQFDILNDDIGDCLRELVSGDYANISIVICVGVVKIDECLMKQDVSYKINVEKTIELITFCERYNIHCIYISSEAVFDGQDGYYSELDVPNPISLYGRQKILVEKYITDECVNTVIVRLSFVVSENIEPKNIFNQWYTVLVDHKPIVCIKEQLYSFTNVNDIAEAMIIIAQEKLTGIIHVTNCEFFYRDELARVFCRLTGFPINIRIVSESDLRLLDRRSTKTYLDGHSFIKKTNFIFTSMRCTINNFMLQLKQRSDS